MDDSKLGQQKYKMHFISVYEKGRMLKVCQKNTVAKVKGALTGHIETF